MENLNEIVNEPIIEPQKPKRQIGLSIMLAFSFFNALLQFFSFFSVFVLFDNVKTLSPQIVETYPFLKDALEILLNANRFFFLWSALCFVISGVGVFLMWKMKKIGFHLYVCAQLAVIFVNIFFMGSQLISVGDIMITALFAVYYATHLRNFR